MNDILFHKNGYLFSYRVAGILIYNGKVLLQKPKDNGDYAFPGGNVAFDELHADTLRREFSEEVGADITVGELKWVEENFWRWSDDDSQHIIIRTRRQKID
jgi:ADP-ribose pyrophosphatase YjhB (NUDIX family)